MNLLLLERMLKELGQQDDLKNKYLQRKQALEKLRDLSKRMSEKMNASTSDVVKTEQPFSAEEIKSIQRLKEMGAKCRGKSFAKPADQQVVIAGGCFVSALHNESPRDIDCFIINDPNKSLIPWFNDLEKQRRCIRNFDNKYSSLSHINGVWDDVNTSLVNKGLRYQYIHTNFLARKALMDTFDFEHCKISYHDSTIFTSPLAIECATNKLLYARTKPKEHRVVKFLNRGFKWHPNSPVKTS